MSRTMLVLTDPARRGLRAMLRDRLGDDAVAAHWLGEDEAARLDTDGADGERRLRDALAGLPVDVIGLPTEPVAIRAFLADMDSTMIGQECIDELADMAGHGQRVAAITARAMNGELAFEPALRERVALLRDLPVEAITRVLDERIRPAPGARQLMATLRRRGIHTALVSGGFTRFTSVVAQWLGFDEHHANVLGEIDGKLTGEVIGPILGREAKLQALGAVAARCGCTTADVMAAGDGANDLAMIQAAGLGIAIHAKPAVAAKAPVRIDHGDLTALLYLIGLRRTDFA